MMHVEQHDEDQFKRQATAAVQRMRVALEHERDAEHDAEPGISLATAERKDAQQH